MQFFYYVWIGFWRLWPGLVAGICLMALSFFFRQRQSIRALLLKLGISIIIVVALTAIMAAALAATFNDAQ